MQPYTPPAKPVPTHQQLYAQPQPQPYSPYPQAPPAVAAPPTGPKKSKVLPLAIGGGVVVAGIIVLVVMLKGGSSGGVGSKDELIKQTLAALSTGNADALVKLASYETLQDKAIECEDKGGGYGGAKQSKEGAKEAAKEGEQIRRNIDKAIKKLDGVTIELVEVLEDGSTTHKQKKGEEATKGCRFKVDMSLAEVKLKVKVTNKAGKSMEQKPELSAAEVDGRWYLLEPPRIKPVGDMSEMLVKFRAYKDQVCACKDVACGEAARKEERQWMKEEQKKLEADTKPSEEEMTAGTEVEHQVTACLAKLEANEAAARAAMAAAAAEAAAAARAADTPPPDPSTSPTANLPTECAAYLDVVAKLQHCAALPQGTRDGMKQAVDALKLMFASSTSLPTMGPTCKSLSDAMPKDMSKLCP